MLRLLVPLLSLQVTALKQGSLKSADVRLTAKKGQVNSARKAKYGFYIHAFAEPKATIHQLREVRRLYPEAPVYIMSDGGMEFSGICKEIGNCEFRWKPPANDRWNPKPFLYRFKEGARWLNTEYVVMLEPDVELDGRITTEPDQDAGGLRDSNPALHKETLDYVEELGRKHTGNPDFTVKWKHFGLAGGMYVRTAAALDAFDADLIDWEKVTKKEGHRAYSSDIAMCLVLAARGYSYYPWEDVSQKRYDVFYNLPNRTRAFRHHGKDEGWKPLYNVPLNKDESTLVRSTYSSTREVYCQGCVWVNSDEECLQKVPISCPTTKPNHW